MTYGVCASTCYENQYVVGGICHNCSFPCTKCFQTADYCVGCPSGKIVLEGKCVIDCPLRKYFDEQKSICEPCKRGCDTCSDADTCLTCAESRYKPIEGGCPYCDSSCVRCGRDGRCRRCKAGLYLFNGACVETCPGNTILENNRCVCLSGVLKDGYCASSCPKGYFAKDKVCELCPSTCQHCE